MFSSSVSLSMASSCGSCASRTSVYIEITTAECVSWNTSEVSFMIRSIHFTHFAFFH
jgi:hypothetical protein